MPVAGTAMVALALLLDYMKNLHFRSGVENLKQVSCKTEYSKKYKPRNIHSEKTEYIINGEKTDDPYPEFE